MDNLPSRQEPTDKAGTCIFCSQATQSIEHLRKCTAMSPDLVHERPTFFNIEGRGYVCKNCFALFTQEGWQSHRKAQSCRKGTTFPFANMDLTTKQHSVIQSSKPPAPRSLPDNHHYHSTTSKDYKSEGHLLHHGRHIAASLDQKDQVVTKDLAGVAQSILTAQIREWTERNQAVDINVLLTYLTSGLLDFGRSFFRQPIVVPTWQQINQADRTLGWTAILERPENPLNQRFVDGKVAKMATKKQARVIKGLNRLAKQFRGLIPHRQVPKADRCPRKRTIVKIFDLFSLLGTLFAVRKKTVVHFALDLYLILLSGQRFLADWQQIQDGVLAQLAHNKGKMLQDFDLTYHMKIGKTQTPHEVCLNNQLCLLLQKFEWKGFHPRTYRIIKRMREWLGVMGYSLKHSMLATTAKATTDLHLAQRVAGHHSLASTRVYTSIRAIADNLKINNRLVVSGLLRDFGHYRDSQVEDFLRSLSEEGIRYSSFQDGWLDQLLKRLYMPYYHKIIKTDSGYDYVQSRIENPLLKLQPLQLIQEHQHSHHHKDLSSGEKQEGLPQHQASSEYRNIYGDREEEMRDILKIDDIIVYDQTVVFRDGSFGIQSAYQETLGYKELKCCSCSRAILSGVMRFRCIFCGDDYHTDCASGLCPCTSRTTALVYPSLPPAYGPKNMQSREKILMPEAYMRGQTKQQQQIKVLLALRRFRYTRVAVEAPGYSVNYPTDYWKQTTWLQFPAFRKYLSGHYMPPIQIQPLKEDTLHYVFGTQFGVFAQEEIRPGVLVGQYGCDLMNQADLSLCKKPDSIMEYTRGVYLAPTDNCGYVLLLNTAVHHGENNNCRSLRIIIQGAFRVLVVTARTIRKGDQLLYDYGDGFDFLPNETKAGRKRK